MRARTSQIASLALTTNVLDATLGTSSIKTMIAKPSQLRQAALIATLATLICAQNVLETATLTLLEPAWPLTTNTVWDNAFFANPTFYSQQGVR